jgi:hypothetical protein
MEYIAQQKIIPACNDKIPSGFPLLDVIAPTPWHQAHWQRV